MADLGIVDLNCQLVLDSSEYDLTSENIFEMNEEDLFKQVDSEDEAHYFSVLILNNLKKIIQKVKSGGMNLDGYVFLTFATGSKKSTIIILPEIQNISPLPDEFEKLEILSSLFLDSKNIDKRFKNTIEKTLYLSQIQLGRLNLAVLSKASSKAVVLITPDNPSLKDSQSFLAWKKFISKLKAEQLARAMDTEDTTVTALLSEIDKFCATMRSGGMSKLSGSATSHNLKICDSLIRRARKIDSEETWTPFLKQRLLSAIELVDEIKNGIRKARKNSINTDNFTNPERSQGGDKSQSHIDMNKFKDSNRKITVPLPETDLNETGDKEWTRLVTGHPSPNGKPASKLIRQRTCPEGKKFDLMNDIKNAELLSKPSPYTDPAKKISFKMSIQEHQEEKKEKQNSAEILSMYLSSELKENLDKFKSEIYTTLDCLMVVDQNGNLIKEKAGDEESLKVDHFKVSFTKPRTKSFKISWTSPQNRSKIRSLIQKL